MRRSALIASFALGLALFVPAAAEAQVLVTTTTDEYSDPGPGAGCSLREAIEAANTDGGFGGCSVPDIGTDQIFLADGVTYSRTRTGVDDTNANGDYDILNESLQIGFVSSAVIQSDATLAGDRVFDVAPTGSALNFDLSDVTLQRGRSGANPGGNVRVSSAGVFGFFDSTVTDGRAATGSGGGIASSGTTVLENVTVSGNSAGLDGGGVATLAGTTTLRNATIASNTADSDDNDSGDGGGIAEPGGTLNFQNTLVGNNSDLSNASSAPDCSSGPDSVDYNLVESTILCSFVPAANDITGQDPVLGSLAVNGGDTATHALLNGSPALDNGNPGPSDGLSDRCAQLDERSIMRPQGVECDIGAYERRPPPSAPPTITDTDPDSPGIDSTPLVKGTSSGDTINVEVFAQANCQGTSTIGSKGSFELNGLTVTVGLNQVNALSAWALGPDNAPTACFSSFPYTHDSIALAPVITSTSPASGSGGTNPSVIGTVEANSTVRVYVAGQCPAGTPLGTGSSAVFGGSGIPITVAANAVTSLVANHTDQAGNVSPCSAAFAYDSTAAPVAATPAPVSAKKCKKKKKKKRSASAAKKKKKCKKKKKR